MAWLERHPTSGRFKISFRYEGRKYRKTLRAATRPEAERVKARVEETLDLVERRRIDPPPADCRDVAAFFLADGRVPEPRARPSRVPFGEVVRRYLEAHGNGVMEANSLATAGLHLRHFLSTLGAGFLLPALTQADLQRHLQKRSERAYRGRPVSPVTLRKEVATFRAAWNWAAGQGLVTGPFPNKDLLYPKTDERPPFRTMAEIERRLRMGTGEDPARLWDGLYLRLGEIGELLEYVRENATQPWVYPLVCTAAHTGARRSELLRLQVPDVDFEARTVLLHERKRSRKERTTREVVLTSFLAGVLQEWLAVHPGGGYLFGQCRQVCRSKKRSPTTGHRSGKSRPTTRAGRQAGTRTRGDVGPMPLTKDEAHDHLKRTLAGSKWEVVRGFHVLRHSYVSGLAADGVDQRVIDDQVGHQTDQQRKRYRHLTPDVKRRAVEAVFGMAVGSPPAVPPSGPPGDSSAFGSDNRPRV